MEFSQTPLGAEYELIMREGKGVYYMYDATFATERENIDALQVVSMDFIRDYRNSASDEILIKLVVPWGQYLNRVLPFKENLKVTITRSEVDTVSGEIVGTRVEQTFIAFLPPETETGMLDNSPETATEFSADISGLKIVQVQLQEEAFRRARSEMVGGVFRDSSPYEVLISLLHNSIRQMDLEIAERIVGVHATPPNNTAKRGTTLIPHGTPLVALADKLQTQLGGIYTAGIGCYLQKGYWHVWPLYNYKLYDSAERTALFILAPSGRYRGVERTYRMVDKHLTVFITGEVLRQDPSEILLLNEGNGVRFANADAMMEGFFEVSGNKAVAKRTNNANEYEAINRKGVSMSRITEDMATTNNFNEASKVAARNGAFITMNWENSNPDLIIPGLQCEIGFLVEGDVCFINGVVVHAHGYSALSGTGLHQRMHQITTEVVCMVDRQSPVYAKFLSSQQSNSTQT